MFEDTYLTLMGKLEKLREEIGKLGEKVDTKKEEELRALDALWGDDYNEKD